MFPAHPRIWGAHSLALRLFHADTSQGIEGQLVVQLPVRRMQMDCLAIYKTTIFKHLAIALLQGDSFRQPIHIIAVGRDLLSCERAERGLQVFTGNDRIIGLQRNREAKLIVVGIGVQPEIILFVYIDFKQGGIFIHNLSYYRFIWKKSKGLGLPKVFSAESTYTGQPDMPGGGACATHV